MKAAELPPIFAEYDQIGGVLEFRAFEGVEVLNEAVALDAVSVAVPGIDREKLKEIGSRTLDDQTFFGDWYDPVRSALVHRGTWRKNGLELKNPALPDLDTFQMSGGSPVPDAGSGGNFAWAYLNPPYALQARPREVQRIFDGMKGYLLPPALSHTILDWSDRRLPEASVYFEEGMDWWGVFLFVIFVPDFQRLVVIAGPETD